MVVANVSSAGRLGVGARLKRLLDAFDRPATPLFVALSIGFGWLFFFSLWRANYADFFQNCNHDSGAALRTDELVALGQRPGVDFFYYYGPLPILVCRAFFSVFGRTPFTLLILLASFGAAFSVALASIVLLFKPTRLGACLITVAIAHVITPAIPTHALEAALLIWAVTLRIRGKTAIALALAVCAVFVKISMGTVITAGLVALTVLDAIRARSSRPLVSLLAIPSSLAVAIVGCGGALGWGSLAASFDVRAGAAVYRAYDVGFLREGRSFWYPAGHTLGWYLGGVPGPWIVASAILVYLAPRGALRLVREAVTGAERTASTVTDETFAIAGFANLAFIIAFFAPAAGCVYYYTWVPLVGVTPLLARARFARYGDPSGRPRGQYGWIALSIFLLLSTKSVLGEFVDVVREPRVQFGEVSMPVDEAEEWKSTLALGRSVGGGAITVVARVANFGLVDPTLREAHYWMMLMGMRNTPSLTELLGLVRSSDTIFVTKHDYPQIVRIPEFYSMLTESERLHDGKYFLLLRPAGARPSPL